MKTMYWVIGVVVVGIAFFVYLLLGDTQKTVPKITLSYFVDEQEIADSVTKRLSQEILQQSFFWIGVEPEKNEQLTVVQKILEKLASEKKFQTIIADQELNLSKEWIEKLHVTEVVMIKENSKIVGELLADLEKKNQPYLLITAAIYSNSLLMKNQIHQMKELYHIMPMTFSFAYFATSAEDEKNMLFPCVTEDHAGTALWGCTVVNKARFTRRKIDTKNTKPWIGLMDLTGEKDYMLLLKKSS